jgi:solute carrier family 35 protein E3
MDASGLRAGLYLCLNVVSACGIVFANKIVLNETGFHFPVALTFIHTAITWLGMQLLACGGAFQVKSVTIRQVVPLAAAFVAYIVLGNLSLQLNTVGFYQIMKVAVAPTVVAMELVLFHQVPEWKTVASVVTVCVGVAASTVTDPDIATNVTGVIIGVASTVVTALFQVWAGSKQKELELNSMQLLHQYSPVASVMLGALVPMVEPVGFPGRAEGTLLAFNPQPMAIAAISISALLGFLVSLSTFLVIGATSPLTYSVVGHVKTVVILAGGFFIFQEAMPWQKLAGVSLAMLGIVWYTYLKLKVPAAPLIIVDGSKQPLLLPVVSLDGSVTQHKSATA